MRTPPSDTEPTPPRQFGLPQPLLADIVRVILAHGDPDRIILFGSRTRGDYDERSDIDLAVDGSVDPGLVRGYLEEEVRTLRTFDVVHLNDLDGGMLSSIAHEGVVIYEKAHE